MVTITNMDNKKRRFRASLLDGGLLGDFLPLVPPMISIMFRVMPCTSYLTLLGLG